MGDKMAVLVAESIKCMHDLESLDISDNNLHCEGICAILEALIQGSNEVFASLDISQNTFGPLSSGLLAQFISSKQCKLTKLGIKHADVDDNECNRFVTAICENGSIKELYLSHNKLGNYSYL